MSDPMPVVKQLIERLQKEAESIGLHLEHVAIMPNMGDGPDFLQGVFSIRPDAVAEETPKDEQQEAFDKMFEDVIQGAKMAEREEQTKSIAEDIKSWLEEK